MALQPPPFKAPALDRSGFFSPEWSSWINGLINLVVGSGTTSNEALAAALAETNATVTALQEQVNALDPDEDGSDVEKYEPVA